MEFTSETSLRLNDLDFSLYMGPDIRQQVSTDENFILMKPRNLIEQLAKTLVPLRPKVVVEFGIQRGGSIAFFNELLKPDLHVAIELFTPPIDALEAYKETISAKGRTLETHYGIDQGDKDTVSAIVRDALNRAGLDRVDLVLDDASHLYGPSKASFEAVFPMMREDGLYVLEDWGWAHWLNYQKEGSPYWEQPALSNLVFEMTMLCASNSQMMSEMTIDRGLAIARRGNGKFDVSNTWMDEMILCRGAEFPAI